MGVRDVGLPGSEEGRVLSILGIGSLNVGPEREHLRPQIEEFVRALGEQIVARGHRLLTGCMNDLDLLVAQGASDWLTEDGVDPRDRVTSYVIKGGAVPHGFPGQVLPSRHTDWRTPERGGMPESIKKADVIVLVGGGTGTRMAAEWGEDSEKQLVPVPAFGGHAQIVYDDLLHDYRNSPDDQRRLEALSEFTSEQGRLAKSVVGFSERLLTSDQVCVIMPFDDDDNLKYALKEFEEICVERDYKCSVVDEMTTNDRIVQEIMRRIGSAAFVIAELSKPKPNVYYELGYAAGLGKELILTAHQKAGTKVELPFDVTDLPILFWKNHTELKEKLRQKLDQMRL
jgi:nucleoside 2-deoxyribosyltransferase